MEGDGFFGWHEDSFFKIILEARHDLQILEIPKKFMKTHGDGLSNVIYLKVPSGKVWKLNLVKQNGKAFLQNGWPEFVEFYSLSNGHTIMFKYEGDSRFNVVIFDMSASEIDYPIDLEACEETPPKKRKTTYHTRSTSLKKAVGKHTVVHDKLMKASVERPLDPKSCKKSPSKEKKSTDHSKPCSLKNGEGMQTELANTLIIDCKGSLTPEEDKRIRSYAYQCKHPLFVKKMQTSFVQTHFEMGVPKEFEKRYLGKKRPLARTFNLLTDNTDKIWPVTVVGDYTHVKFRMGWKDFALDNKLRVGDICIFELINKREFKVGIPRVTRPNNRKNLAIKTEAE